MTKKTKKITKKRDRPSDRPVELNHLLAERLRVAFLVIYGAIVLFLLLSLFSYSTTDPGWTVTRSSATVHNYAGIIGAYSANFILAVLGVFGFVLPFIMIYGMWLSFVEKKSFAESSSLLMLMRLFGVLLLFVSGSTLAEIALSVFSNSMPEGSGGILGQIVSQYMVSYLSTPGSILMLIVGLFLGLTLLSGGYWISLLFDLSSLITRALKKAWHKSILGLHSWREEKAARKQAKAEERAQKRFQKQQVQREETQLPTFDTPLLEESKIEHLQFRELDKSVLPVFDIETVIENDSKETYQSLQQELIQQREAAKNNSKKQKTGKAKTDKKTGLPSLELLDPPERVNEGISQAFLDRMSTLVEEKLADFGIQVKVVGAYPGPVITRFEIELAAGVKVSKLSGLAQDLARSLSTTRVRVVEVIPGKPYVGIEIPNQKREMVRLKEILIHKKFKESNSPVTIGIGVDISGTPEIANLAKMPHLLVAGTTGSGKSVGVNAMILSMLYKSSPDDLRLIMIDPKMLELSIYEGIPHLLTPVVTDMTEAANALRWCVKEMDRRYELMAALGVRSIASLNEKVTGTQKSGQPLKDPLWQKRHPGEEAQAPDLEKLPFIVVIADEFADMMMVVGKKVEELIARLAQKARAAGIHIILATQRPSVDVVTGLIKANIPTRIAFQVSSKIDSRTILDQQGAEALLGNGDMLYLPPGSGVPHRVHGAFVDDDEVHRVVAAWKQMGEPEYIDNLTTSEEDSSEVTDEREKDPLYDEAVKIVIDSQRASISNIQRRLRIGYNRSARLIEDMEAAGIVSEVQSNGMRDVLIKR
ncbi:MAG: DNA translocase FtsK [Francisellaceae bacterium]